MVLMMAEVSLALAFLVFWVMILILTVILDNKFMNKEVLKTKHKNDDIEKILQKK